MVDLLHRQFDLAEQAARRRVGPNATDGGEPADALAAVPVTWIPQLVALATRVLASFEDRVVFLEAYAEHRCTPPSTSPCARAHSRLRAGKSR